MDNERFQKTDAWIFLSINNLEGGISLEDFVAKADWINHAIPSKEEIEGAINRLSGAGLVRFENRRFIFTDSGKELYERIHSKRGSMLTLWDKLEKYLNKSTFPSLEVEEFHLDLGQLHVAYKTHHKRFWKTYNQMKSKRKKGKSS
jgi:hypothetical protein